MRSVLSTTPHTGFTPRRKGQVGELMQLSLDSTGRLRSGENHGHSAQRWILVEVLLASLLRELDTPVVLDLGLTLLKPFPQLSLGRPDRRPQLFESRLHVSDLAVAVQASWADLRGLRHCRLMEDRHQVLSNSRHQTRGISQQAPVHSVLDLLPPAVFPVPGCPQHMARKLGRRDLEHRGAMLHQARLASSGGLPSRAYSKLGDLVDLTRVRRASCLRRVGTPDRTDPAELLQLGHLVSGLRGMLPFVSALTTSLLGTTSGLAFALLSALAKRLLLGLLPLALLVVLLFSLLIGHLAPRLPVLSLPLEGLSVIPREAGALLALPAILQSQRVFRRLRRDWSQGLLRFLHRLGRLFLGA